MARETKAQIMVSVSDAVKSEVIANNTVRYTRVNGDIVYRLHQTDIVTRHAMGVYTLNSGGWRTPTTRDRINEYAPVRVSQRKGQWFVTPQGGGEEAPFVDGMTVDDRGHPLAGGPDADKITAKRAKLDKRIVLFCDKIDKLEALPKPDGGDCWLCLFHPPGLSPSRPEFPTCLDSHMKEGYLHGALLRNAMRAKGYTDPSIGLHYQMGNKDTFKRALKAYLRRWADTQAS